MACSSSWGFSIVTQRPGLVNATLALGVQARVSVLAVREAENGLGHQSHRWESDICHLTVSRPRVFGNEVLGSGDPGVWPLV